MLRRLARWMPLLVVAVVPLATPARADQGLQQLTRLCSGAAGRADTHRGPPVAVARQQMVGQYAVSVWADTDVGAGKVYVVVAPQHGEPFVAPRSVSIALRPVSGAQPERRYAAYFDPVRHGARFVAAVALDRVDTWQVRVHIDGASGVGEVQASFASLAPAPMALSSLFFSAAPFVLVAGLWGPWRLVRRRQPATRPASIPSP